MNFVVKIDWKFVVAFGAVTVSTILAVKMDASAAEKVSLRAVDAFKDYVIAENSNH